MPTGDLSLSQWSNLGELNPELSKPREIEMHKAHRINTGVAPPFRSMEGAFGCMGFSGKQLRNTLSSNCTHNHKVMGRFAHTPYPHTHTHTHTHTPFLPTHTSHARDTIWLTLRRDMLQWSVEDKEWTLYSQCRWQRKGKHPLDHLLAQDLVTNPVKIKAIKD